VIRVATTEDFAWIISVAEVVYRELGDYHAIMSSWLGYPGVVTHVCDTAAGPAGFTLVGFYHPEEGPAAYVADLLAIAVEGRHQRQGIGRRLLDHAIGLSRAGGPEGPAQEMRLSVAEHNQVGRRLFEAFGFRMADREQGHYDGGQRALRMAMAL